MIEARDFSGLLGTLIGISDRMLDEHIGLYRGYVEKLNAIEAEYPKLNWGGAWEINSTTGQQASLLDTPIASLDLSIDDVLAKSISQVDQELLAAGISWRPTIVLGDPSFWCADKGTTVNVPWFLANAEVWSLVNDRKAKYSQAEVLGALRHEFAHALGYAYQLWERSDWIAVFGNMDMPYDARYLADPTDNDHVRYLHRTGDRNYAQKHPDDDWAETFAAWLDPTEHALDKYKGVGKAGSKVAYVEALVRGGVFNGPPVNTAPGKTVPYRSLLGTVRQYLGDAGPSAAWNPHSELLRREPYVWNAVVLHELYFEALHPGAHQMTERFMRLVTEAFGTVESYLLDLRAIAGSTNGWALSVWDPRRQRIANVLVEDHRTGPLAGCPVLLALDCWEHAYAMDYGTNKELYLAALFLNLDWNVVDARLPVAVL